MTLRHKATRLLFLAAAVVLGLVMAAGDFQGPPVHAQGNHNGTVRLTTTQTRVYEGAAVLFTLTRFGGPMGEAVTVRLQSWEHNRTTGFGVNPSSQIHYVTIEPWQDTATLTFTTYVDGVSETGYDPLDVNITDVDSGYQSGQPFGRPPSRSTTRQAAAPLSEYPPASGLRRREDLPPSPSAAAGTSLPT